MRKDGTVTVIEQIAPFWFFIAKIILYIFGPVLCNSSAYIMIAK